MKKPFGNLEGLKAKQLKSIERVGVRRTDRTRIIGVDLARELGELAWEIGRNVGVLLDRSGHVAYVLVGDMQGVPLPADLGPSPQPGRLKGLRLVRTELSGRKELVDADRELIVRHRLDGLHRLLLDATGDVLWVTTAQIDPARFDKDSGDVTIVVEHPNRRLTALSDDYLEGLEALEEEIGRHALGVRTAAAGERAMCLVVHPGHLDTAESRMDELIELSRSALFDVVCVSYQRRARPDPRTFIGKGKLTEVCREAVKYAASYLILDTELSGVQLRNLEDLTGLSVIDRTELVLRIFERRARTRAAKLRVALARRRYQLPRLVVRQHGMSRIARGSLGGAGTRGKGEPWLEIQRRRMRDQIHRLESLLERVARQQRTGRKHRLQSGTPIASLVGYTNAGKSSWLNALTESDQLAESLLFATLDTAARKTRLPGGTEVILSDTVGFLRDLPEGLRDAFRSTLEELLESDLLIHIVDISASDWEDREAAVLDTLAELGADTVPMLTLYNKADLVDAGAIRPLLREGTALVSVLDKHDRYRVRELIEEHCRQVSST